MIRATEQQSYNKLFAECYSTHFQKTFNAGKRIPKEQQKFADYLQRGGNIIQLCYPTFLYRNFYNIFWFCPCCKIHCSSISIDYFLTSRCLKESSKFTTWYRIRAKWPALQPKHDWKQSLRALKIILVAVFRHVEYHFVAYFRVTTILLYK